MAENGIDEFETPGLWARVSDVRSFVFAKSAERRSGDSSVVGDVEEGDGEDGKEVDIGISVAIRRTSLGVRIRLQDENANWSLMADVALEYDWDGPVEYDALEVRRFMRGEGIPRALASAAAIYGDAAMSIGVKVTNHSFAAQSAVVEHFENSFSDSELLNIADR